MDVTPVTLEGARVRLVPMTVEHVDALCAVGLDPEIWRLTTSRVVTREDWRRVKAGLEEKRSPQPG